MKKPLEDMSNDELEIELNGRLIAAFYEEIYNPDTESEKAHNCAIVRNIELVRSEIDKRKK